jgi:hypothetical protein
VRIIPVEYSEVITIAPMTAMISWPSSKNAPSEVWVASNPTFWNGWSVKFAAVPAATAMPRPTETTNSAPSVQ